MTIREVLEELRRGLDEHPEYAPVVAAIGTFALVIVVGVVVSIVR